MSGYWQAAHVLQGDKFALVLLLLGDYRLAGGVKLLCGIMFALGKDHREIERQRTLERYQR